MLIVNHVLSPMILAIVVGYIIPLTDRYTPHSPMRQHPLRSHRHRSQGEPASPHPLRQAMPTLLLVPRHLLDPLHSPPTPQVAYSISDLIKFFSSALIRCETRGGCLITIQLSHQFSLLYTLYISIYLINTFLQLIQVPSKLASDFWFS